MVGQIALTFCLLASPPKVKSDRVIDLFVINGNRPLSTGTNWIENPQPNEPIEAALRPGIEPLVRANREFLIVDGGEGPLASSSGHPRTVTISQTWFATTDSETQTIGLRKEVVQSTHSVITCSSTVQPQKYSVNSTYRSSAFVYPHAGYTVSGPSLTIQDLNSYRNCLVNIRPDEGDPTSVMLLSTDTSQETERIVQEIDPKFRGICICAEGEVSDEDARIIPLPSAGVAVHYEITRKNQTWGLHRVGYLRSPDR